MHRSAKLVSSGPSRGQMKLFQIVGTVALSVSAVASAMPDATVYPAATPSDRQSRFSLVGDIA